MSLNFEEKDCLPETGEEYLRQVHLEALNCPSVVVADNIDTRKFMVKQTVKVTNDNGCSSAPGGLAPSENWQRHQVSEFSKLRMLLSRYSDRSISERQTATKSKWPDINNDYEWCIFCFGNEFRSQLRQKFTFLIANPKSSSSHNNVTRVSPNLSVVNSMSQPIITKLLEYQIDWFEVMGYSTELGRWLYALLACLEKPLTPETCSSLRSLARHCTKFRANLTNPEDEILHALNLFICLVARYFDQVDMADVSAET
ncbi:gem (nuclear organelle) associated protein 2 [Chamberlinius hualienensis]